MRLRKVTLSSRSGSIITSTYLGFNSPAAFRELLNLEGIRVYVHPDSTAGFHAKGYIFNQESSTTAIVGSSNLTERALLLNHEWNLRFSALSEGDVVQQLKGSDVSESTKYEDDFINPSTLTWFTRSRRTLESGEVKAIVENQLPLHVFAKKDDSEGTDFFYLGKATSQDPRQTKMAGDSGVELDVVSMTLRLANPIETSLYEYFAARTMSAISD